MSKDEFIQELKKLGIVLTKEQLENLDIYYNLLKEENKKYNLTAITEEKEVYLKHFYDSITTTKIINLESQSICDIGTGAGFPGLVLKIVFPNIKLTLIDATLKKCNFLQLVTQTLKLNDVKIINDRIENYAKTKREIFDIVISRAVAPLKHLLEYGIPLVKVNGNFICLKGNIDNEIKNIDNYYQKLNIIEEKKEIFKLPIENSLRTIISYKKLKPTSLTYPRSYNEIKKREL